MFDINHWTFSALKQFETCPRQYAEIRIYRNFRDAPNDKALYGDRLHKAAEDYVRNGTPLPEEFGYIAPVVDALVTNANYVAHPEIELAMGYKGEPMEYDDPARWFRGKADLAMLPKAGSLARVVDYKTGNPRYADTDQLELMSALIMAHHAHIDIVRGALLFVMSPSAMVTHTTTREQIPDILAKYRERNAMRLSAYHSGNWRAKPSGLCKRFCVVTSCEHKGG